MAKYEITSSKSGAHLGSYEAASVTEALDAMARDAGYASAADAAEVTGDDGSHLVVTEAVETG